MFCMRTPNTHGGKESYSAGVYKKIIPMERLEFTSYLSDRDRNVIDSDQAEVSSDFPSNIEFVIEFIAKGGRTELKITEHGWTQGKMLKYAIMEMNQSLDKLAAKLADMKQENLN